MQSQLIRKEQLASGPSNSTLPYKLSDVLVLVERYVFNISLPLVKKTNEGQQFFVNS
jgi:hypothetical protein